jgi:hypothetical protein
MLLQHAQLFVNGALRLIAGTACKRARLTAPEIVLTGLFTRTIIERG